MKEKRVNLITRLLDGIRLKNSLDKSNEIISALSTLEKFNNVLTVDTFKVIVDNKVKKDPKGCLFLADINNLKQANLAYGNEEKVDEIISQIIVQIENLIQQEGITKENYDIGKMGDEIYVYSSTITPEQYENLINMLNQVEVAPLSISVGGTSELAKGLGQAIVKADSDMLVHKKDKKEENLEKIFETDAENIMLAWIRSMLTKLRIDLKVLDASSKSDFIENIKKSERYVITSSSEIDNIKKKIKEEAKRQLLNKNNQDTDVTIRKKALIEEQIKDKYHIDISEEEMERLVLSNILTFMSVTKDDYIKYNYFLKFGEKSLLDRDSKRTIEKAEKMQVLSFDIGKIKYINDHYGYEVCDKKIEKILTKVSELLEVLKIEPKTPIISQGIGFHSIILDNNVTEEQISQFMQKLKIIEKQNDMTINCTAPIPLVTDKKTDIEQNEGLSGQETFNNLFIRALKTNREKIQIVSHEKKIRDTDVMITVISEDLITIMHNPVLQRYIVESREDNKNEDDILDELIDRALTQMIQKEGALDTDKAKKIENIVPDKIDKEEER